MLILRAAKAIQEGYELPAICTQHLILHLLTPPA